MPASFAPSNAANVFTKSGLQAQKCLRSDGMAGAQAGHPTDPTESWESNAAPLFVLKQSAALQQLRSPGLQIDWSNALQQFAVHGSAAKWSGRSLCPVAVATSHESGHLGVLLLASARPLELLQDGGQFADAAASWVSMANGHFSSVMAANLAKARLPGFQSREWSGTDAT